MTEQEIIFHLKNNIKYEKKPSEAKQRYEKERIRALKQKYIIWKKL